MHIGKKAAFLSAVAGALVLGAGGAAGACADHHHSAPGGSSQRNECSTSTGTIADTSATAKTGDLSFDSNCINVDETRRAHQSNECETSSGTTTLLSALAPTGKVEVSSNCANIAVDHEHGYGH